jgi:glycerol-3-phosphate dehydrogenase
LYVRGLGCIYPPEWAFALVENGVQNGLHLYLGTPVTAVDKEEDATYRVRTPKGNVRTKYIVNAAGLFADEVAWMVGDQDVRLILRKGIMAILDKSVSHLLQNHMVYGTFSPRHSQVLAPTAHGNLILGISYTKPERKDDTEVTREGLQEIVRMGKELVPALSEKDIIAGFTGLVADNNKAPMNGDFYVAHSEHAPGVIHVVVGGPGLTASPAIAELVIQMLSEAGMQMDEKKFFQKKREAWPRVSALPREERGERIKANPKYGRVVCRCEQVSEGEIAEVIRRGAISLDAVKHVTRAGMGRCQGNFCSHSVLTVLAEERHISAAEVAQKGNDSYVIAGHLKRREVG